MAAVYVYFGEERAGYVGDETELWKEAKLTEGLSNANSSIRTLPKCGVRVSSKANFAP
jgi:hypothetical protein